jgi:hypothetical protein
MDLSGVLAISGKPGLYKMVAQSKNGLIVEDFDQGKRFPVYSTHQISALEEISIYTYEDDVPLAEVFEKMYEVLNGEKAMSPKSSKNELMAFFEQVLPYYHQEQVYPSDVKKIIQWYNIFHKHDMLKFDDKKEDINDAEEPADKEAGKASESGTDQNAEA